MKALFGILVACAACGTTPANTVLPAGTTAFELDFGSGEPSPAPGSTCNPGSNVYRYVLATRVLSWDLCTAGSDGVYSPASGTTTLDAHVASQLVASLQALEQPSELCAIADFSANFVFDTPAGSESVDEGECLVGFDDVYRAVSAAAQ